MSESEQQQKSSTDKKQEYKQRYYNKEMTEIFESFEWPLYELFDRADGIMAKISTEASACQIPAEFRANFMRERVIDMFEQIAEQRMGKKDAM
ncbi:hypothetical protein [Paenibacillus apis]|uniref:Uncharacterized protein n=1 Tax=Paenibacillus apis TaxID=1792174 RepID=A0A919Y1R2_9BACL|nr:hypothetical protein [Paenibacillus apis]GIO42511.1 hypothetical protein J41TS4_22690 [Paenibacillus apis]